jgi:hypothetical protein
MNNIKETMENNMNINTDQYIETPWTIIEAYFKGQHLKISSSSTRII